MENTYCAIKTIEDIHAGDEVQCCLDGASLIYDSYGNFRWFTGKVNSIKITSNRELDISLHRHDSGQSWYVRLALANMVGLKLSQKEWD